MTLPCAALPIAHNCCCLFPPSDQAPTLVRENYPEISTGMHHPHTARAHTTSNRLVQTADKKRYRIEGNASPRKRETTKQARQAQNEKELKLLS